MKVLCSNLSKRSVPRSLSFICDGMLRSLRMLAITFATSTADVAFLLLIVPSHFPRHFIGKHISFCLPMFSGKDLDFVPIGVAWTRSKRLLTFLHESLLSQFAKATTGLFGSPRSIPLHKLSINKHKNMILSSYHYSPFMSTIYSPYKNRYRFTRSRTTGSFEPYRTRVNRYLSSCCIKKERRSASPPTILILH